MRGEIVQRYAAGAKKGIWVGRALRQNDVPGGSAITVGSTGYLAASREWKACPVSPGVQDNKGSAAGVKWLVKLRPLAMSQAQRNGEVYSLSVAWRWSAGWKT